MLINRIKGKIHDNFQFFKKKDKLSVLIIDDLLPSPLFPWRNYEFDELIKEIPQTSVVCDLNIFRFYSRNKTFEENLIDLGVDYPSLAKQCKKLRLFQNSNVSLVYMLFFHNVSRYFAHFERHKMHFAFTLYPGGGFVIGNNQINERLKQICKSSYFKGLVVNQPFLYDYLIQNKIVEANKIHLISGVPLKTDNYSPSEIHERKFQNQIIEIVFIANKYMVQGFDKGFDLFQMIAQQLLKSTNSLTFHVIGGFSENDLIFPQLNEFFIFHGQLHESKMGEVFSKTQICISPNRRNALAEGAFDGFPLASSVTAGLYNNLLLLTDPLNQSQEVGLIDGEDFIKISLDLFDVDAILKNIIADRNKMKQIAFAGKNKLQYLYGKENQISPRIKFIKSILEQNDSGN